MADTLTLTNPIPVTCEGCGGGSGSEASGTTMFVNEIMVEPEDSGYFRLDKTWNEINNALNSGQMVVLIRPFIGEGYTRNYYYLLEYTSVYVNDVYDVRFNGNIDYAEGDPDAYLTNYYGD